VLSRYAPPGVVLDPDLSIVQFRGHTGPYQEAAPGEASLSVLKMAREGLALELRTALHQARRTGATVRASGIVLHQAGQARTVSIEVIPLSRGGHAGEDLAGPPRSAGDAGSATDPLAPDSPASSGADERWFVVLFLEQPEGSPELAGRASRTLEAEERIARLERELAATKEYLSVTIEEQEATHEELHSANDELLSSNEELQGINEELQTATEQQEAAQEELTTLNQELYARNGELDHANDDLGNLLASVNIPMVMLGHDLRIRRFTPPAERVLNLMARDVGRPIGDVRLRIHTPDLERLVAEVIDTTEAREIEVQSREGTWYSLRIRPCRNADNKIDGAVVALVDIDRLRRERGSEPVAAGKG
jgi:two-component system CheB/CheR fusion protein